MSIWSPPALEWKTCFSTPSQREKSRSPFHSLPQWVAKDTPTKRKTIHLPTYLHIFLSRHYVFIWSAVVCRRWRKRAFTHQTLVWRTAWRSFGRLCGTLLVRWWWTETFSTGETWLQLTTTAENLMYVDADSPQNIMIFCWGFIGSTSARCSRALLCLVCGVQSNYYNPQQTCISCNWSTLTNAEGVHSSQQRLWLS